MDWLADRLPWWLDWRHRVTLRLPSLTLRVIRGECERVDTAVIATWARRAYGDMRIIHGELPHLTLRMRGKHEPGRYGSYRPGMIYFRCGHENVVRHELFHAWARALGLGYARTIDHPGGHDLDGTPRS